MPICERLSLIATMRLPIDTADEPRPPAERSCDADHAAEQAHLRAAVAELRSAVLARDEFISMIAHEMRNPMTPLLMQANSLLLQARGDEGVPHRIVRSIELLNSIVEDFMRRATVLLDISRMNAGIYRLERCRADWSSILRGVLQRMAVQAAHASVAIHSDVQDDVIGQWDVLALEQIADNLLSNAIKYGDCRPVHMRLRADASHAVFSVRDEGSGISQPNLARIFARFERAVTQGRGSGFGVGLWLVGRLVKEMQGAIDVQSAPGRGSTFTVRLPLDLPVGDGT